MVDTHTAAAGSGSEREKSAPARQERLIVGSGGAGWASVEAIDPQTGLTHWAYVPHRQLNSVVGGDELVYVATQVERTRSHFDPAQIVALRATDGQRVWRMDCARLQRRLIVRRLARGLQVGVQSSNPVTGLRALSDFGITNHLSLKFDVRGDGASVTSDASLIASDGYVLFALNARTGSVRWLVPVSPNVHHRLLDVRDGNVYLTPNSSCIDALDARTGRRMWSYQLHGMVHDAVAGNAVVYVHQQERNSARIVTLRALDGSPVRTSDLGKVRSKNAAALAAITPDGIAYVLRDRRLHALKLATNTEQWQSPPYLVESSVGDDQGEISLLTHGIAGGGRVGVFAYTINSPATRTSALHLRAFDRQAGDDVWRWPDTTRAYSDTSSDPSRGYGTLLAAFGVVCVRANDGLHAFDIATGRQLWHTPPGFDITHLAMVPAQAGGDG